ncbi:hypothetical protein FF2_027133 [Malus domestica]
MPLPSFSFPVGFFPALSPKNYPATLARLPSRPSNPQQRFGGRREKLSTDLITFALATSRPIFLSLPPAMMVYEYLRKIRARILVPANPPFPLHLQPCASRFAARSKLWHASGGDVDFSSALVIPSLVLCGVAAIKFMADLETDELFARRMNPIENSEAGAGEEDGTDEDGSKN